MCTDAMATILPVFGTITIAWAPLAPSAATRFNSACSVANWIERSTVSTMSEPSTGFSVVRSLPATVRPPGATSSVSSPGLPPSTFWYWRSSPAIPLPSMSVFPMTLRPVSPPGSVRRSSG